MARILSEAKAMTEYKPISAAVKTTEQLDHLKQFINLLTESDEKRAAARKIITGSDKLHSAYKNNIGLLVHEANIRYNGYAIKVAKAKERRVKVDQDVLQQNLIECIGTMEPDDIVAAIQMATPLMALQAVFDMFGIPGAVIEECYNKAMEEAEAAEAMYKVEVYKYQDTSDASMVERIQEDILAEPAVEKFVPRPQLTLNKASGKLVDAIATQSIPTPAAPKLIVRPSNKPTFRK